MTQQCLCLLLIILLFFLLGGQKETYKKQRRQGIRAGWKRKGKSGQTVAKTGTRWPQWPEVIDERFNLIDYESPKESVAVIDYQIPKLI